jgi:hypothetical protein
MKYFLPIKNKDIMKCSGRWIRLENIIQSEVIEAQKGTHGMYSYVDMSHNLQDNYSRMGLWDISGASQRPGMWEAPGSL